MNKTIIRPQPGPQTDFLSCSADVAIYGGAAGGGKAITIETPILTPLGWSTMGELRTGGYVYSTTGEAIQIVKAHPVYIPDILYEITFDNGAVLHADSNHLWHTLTDKDRHKTYKGLPKTRDKRRERRKLRGTGKRPDLAVFNTARALAHQSELPSGSVKTTEDIKQSLITTRGSLNHTIALPQPIQGYLWPCDIPPYLLGLWLGDGTTCTGSITTADKEILHFLTDLGETIRKVPSSKYVYRVENFTTRLKACGLLNHKHIPDFVYTANTDARLEVLRGLLDSDGYCSEGGKIEFSVSLFRLAEDLVRLASTLSIKCSLTSSDSYLYKKYCGQRYRIQFRAPFPVFNLTRKAERQNMTVRKTTRQYYIKNITQIPPRPVRCITVDSTDGLYLVGNNCIPTHNTFSLLLEPLHYITVPGYNATVFRRTFPQITRAGGLWDEATQLYTPLGATLFKTPQLQARFGKTSKVDFAAMQYETDMYSWQGSQLCAILWDELTHFTRAQFFYMLSRNRSTCGIRPYVRGTCNPDPDHWLGEFMSWYIDQDTGYPIPERSGKVRFFTREGDTIHWASTRKALKPFINITKEDIENGIKPGDLVKSFSFINSSVYDNKILLQKDPGYVASLKSLPEVEQQQLLYGNWKIKRAKGDYFRRHWFTIIKSKPPAHMIKAAVRGWDRAATEKTESNNPDYTVGVLILKTVDDEYIIADVVRFRERPGKRNRLIIQTALQDKEIYPIVRNVIEQDPGQAGVEEAESLIKEFTNNGLLADRDRVSGKKAVRAMPYSAAVENGLCCVVRGPWNDAYFLELEQFSDNDKEYAHDDQIDASSVAFNRLNSAGGSYTLEGITTL